MAEVINILMCGGSRAGKTSILAAMQANMQTICADGRVRMTPEDNQDITDFQDEQNAIATKHVLDYTTFADEHPTNQRNSFGCTIYLNNNGKSTPMSLNFIDVPGEYFLATDQSEDHEKLMADLESSEIIVIAIDSPHLMEERQDNQAVGKYHEVFNRADRITDLMKQAFQGKQKHRMVLLVPVKCEAYTESAEFHRVNRRGELLKAVNAGYADLLSYLKGDSMKDYCTVAICPVVTMGGLVFMNFEPPEDKNGNLKLEEPDIAIAPNGRLVMTYRSKYLRLRRRIQTFYEPADCEQPLLHILLFFVAMGRLRAKNAGLIAKLLNLLFNILPDQAELEACKKAILPKVKQDPTYGFEVVQDPLEAYKEDKNGQS